MLITFNEEQQLALAIYILLILNYKCLLLSFFRCKKVLVVISAASLESDLFHFQLKVAHSMSPGMSGMLCYSSFLIYRADLFLNEEETLRISVDV